MKGILGALALACGARREQLCEKAGSRVPDGRARADDGEGRVA